MDAPENIVANTEYHARLLSTISGLEYVPQAKKDQIEYLKDLQRQIEIGQRKIAALAEKTKKEKKEHEALQHSIGKKLAHTITGQREKFAQKASKEEREYVEALEREMTERDNQKTLIRMKEEGDKLLEDLNMKEAKHQSAQAELKTLYSRIFDGPTQAFPEDDRLEHEIMFSIRKHEQAQAKLNVESRGADLLAKAAEAMAAAHQNGMEALRYSTADLFGRGRFMDVMERSALRRTQAFARQAQMLVDQARQVSPSIQPMPRLTIAEGCFFGDVLFDNVFSDAIFRNKVKESLNQIIIASGRVKAERNAAVARLNAAGAELVTTSKILEGQRRELDAFRRSTFTSYAAQHQPPPNYDSIMAPSTVESPGRQTQQAATGPSIPAPVNKDVMAPPPTFPHPGPSQPTLEASQSLFSMPEPWVNPSPTSWGEAETRLRMPSPNRRRSPKPNAS